MVRHFENIDKRYISSDAESREEQDGANHFRIEATMAKLSPNFYADAAKKEKERILLLL